jgi:transcriptional regulator with XRE-family HTH domain
MASKLPTPLKRLRAQLGLKQKDLAGALNVSQQTIARWEGGGAIPSKYLKDLSIILGCRVSDLLKTAGTLPKPIGWRAQLSAPESDPERPYGTARVIFMPTPGVLVRDASRDASESDPQRTREYPIAEGERTRLHGRLSLREDQATWFSFQTLDNRLVFVNRSELELFEMISDDAEEMPTFYPEEVYRALSDPAMMEALVGEISPSEIESEAFPYSRKLIAVCSEILEEWGGLDATKDRMSYIAFETKDGRRYVEFSDPDEDAFAEMSLLEMYIDLDSESDSIPTAEWMIELGGEGYFRSSRYRLGALRLIEVPLLAFDAYRASLYADQEDGEDGKG